MKDRILILSAHPDDGELGCGGTIARFIEEKRKVYHIIFSNTENLPIKNLPKNIREIEVKKSAEILGINTERVIIKRYPTRYFQKYRQEILDDMIKIKNEISPEIVFIPSSYDIHQDHQVLNVEAKRAFKHKCILGYNFIWNIFSFTYHYFFEITENQLNKKILAVKQFRSQKERDYVSEEFLRSNAMCMGLQAGVKYAEAFEVIRWVE